MSTTCNTRIGPLLAVALGSIIFPVNIVIADPPSSAPSTDRKDTRNRILLQQRFQSLDEAIARAEEELETESRVKTAALVYTIRAADDQTVHARTELRYLGKSGSGYLPGKITTSQFMLQPVFILSTPRPVELHIIAPGFDTYKRRVILHAGELIVWDDIVLEPMTERSTASVMGRVWLDDEEENLEGIVIYIDQEAVTFTDASGYFMADRVRAGKLRVSAHKPGYVGLETKVRVAGGYEQVCELNGYRKRSAHVRWAYQPDGSRDFDGDIPTGTAMLSSRKLYRVSFAEGFKQVSGHSDFFVTQVEEKLVFRHFDVFGTKMPASVRIKDTRLDELSEAPETGYKRNDTPLRPGDLYVFRCYDGKHYAMMEVLDVTIEP